MAVMLNIFKIEHEKTDPLNYLMVHMELYAPSYMFKFKILY